MARSDYAHHNEEQDIVWWHEEGKHQLAEPDWDDEPTLWDERDDDEDDYRREEHDDEPTEKTEKTVHDPRCCR